MLRNRGFAMDSAEETLRQKLLLLERSVLDPALNGRSEEIWARMVSTRERVRQLQREFERAGKGVKAEDGVVDEEVMKRVRKVSRRYITETTSTIADFYPTDLGRLQLPARASDEGTGTDQ